MKVSVGLKALAIQLLSLLLGFACVIVASRFLDLRIPPFIFLVSCGLFGAVISHYLRFDWWWSLIQICFFPLIYLALSLQVQPWIYLTAALISVLLFWATHRTQVPYYPSPDQLASPLQKLIEQEGASRFIDVGCGFGGVLFDLEKGAPTTRFFGIEIAPLPYWICRFRGALLRSNVKFLFGRYETRNFAEYDLVFCYLSPVAMPMIWQKLSHEMRPGSLFLSYEFIVPSVEPSFVLEIGTDMPPLYGWRI